MGNLCGKETSDPFAQPGRTLGSSPKPATGTARLPHRIAGPAAGGRTLGGRMETDDARMAAAQAAQVSSGSLRL